MERDFPNPNQLPVKILERRFAALDDSALFEVVSVKSLFDPEAPIKHVVGINSMLTDEEISALLVDPITVEEQNYLAEFDSDRRNFRQQYQETRDQLQAIEDLTAPTNAQIVQAVKYLAKTLRLLLRLLVKTRFSH